MERDASPPRAGTGLHDYILDFTRRRLLDGLSEKQVFEATFAATRHCGRSPIHLVREIRNAIAGALGWIAARPDLIIPNVDGHGGRPGIDRMVKELGWASRCSEDGLRYKRPLPRHRWGQALNPRKALRILRGPEPKLSPLPAEKFSLGDLYGDYDFILCLASSVFDPRARPVEYWERQPPRVRSGWQWMVPNPCLEPGNGGWTKSDENADERIWLIVEFDSGSLRDQTKLLVWLGEAFEDWELAMIVYSGGKSLHGWFSCVDKSERHEIFAFFRMASSIGADLAMSSSVQYTRVPWGTNTKTGQRQEILHWNPAAIETHNRNLNDRQESW